MFTDEEAWDSVMFYRLVIQSLVLFPEAGKSCSPCKSASLMSRAQLIPLFPFLSLCNSCTEQVLERERV